MVRQLEIPDTMYISFKGRKARLDAESTREILTLLDYVMIDDLCNKSSYSVHHQMQQVGDVLLGLFDHFDFGHGRSLHDYGFQDGPAASHHYYDEEDNAG